MGKLVQFVTSLHTSTKENIWNRIVDEKILCMLKAKEYEEDYWDGDRRFGYGVINIFWEMKPVAESLIETYNWNNSSSILDVGCGKGFLLHEIKLLLPEVTIKGFDISNHGSKLRIRFS